jgi:L-lactate dehydrogenase complex protein LldG
LWRQIEWQIGKAWQKLRSFRCVRTDISVCGAIVPNCRLAVYPSGYNARQNFLVAKGGRAIIAPFSSTLITMTSREEILSRVRANLGAEPGDEARRQAALASVAERQQGPRPTFGCDAEALVTRFAAKSAAMASTVETVGCLLDVPAAVVRYLAAQDLPLQAACWPSLSGLDWSGAGLAVAARAANGDDPVGITGCFCAIAETGTLMLVSGPETAATTSLLPETHIAVVPVARIVPAMEEGFALLRAEFGENLPRAVNFVSGPSRTGDIEQTIVLGAHGPYRVHLILIDNV